jgi:hypothetical protein
MTPKKHHIIFVFNFLTHENLSVNSLRLYSYPKTSAIRIVKNISLFIAAGLVITTLVFLSNTAKKDTAVDPSPTSVGSHDRKIQVDQAKKNSILRRFISYYQVERISY